MTSNDQTSVDRRGFLAAATGAAVMVGSWWTDLGTAHADVHRLPAAGEEIRCVSRAGGVVLRGPAMEGRVDVTCDILLKAEVDAHDPRVRRLRILRHRMEGWSAEFGEISITQDAESGKRVPVPRSTVRLMDGAARRYALHLECDRLKVRVERVPVDLRRVGLPVALSQVAPAQGPLTFVSTEPLVLESDNLGDWRFHHHTLASRRSVGLALPQVPGLAVATIEPFTVDSEHVKS
jgi:hypothetical protein